MGLVKKCVVFYTDVLRLTRVESPIKQTVWFGEGVHLYWGGDYQYSIENLPPPRHFALVVGNRYEEIVEHCKFAGYFLSKGTEYWDSPRCYIKDPAGNRIELIEFGAVIRRMYA